LVVYYRIGPGGCVIAAQANNPLANMTAFNLHNYYIGEQTETGEDANQFWLRYARPISLGGDWLMRASLPINSFPNSSTGDTNTALKMISFTTAINQLC
jgi:hypothetical protein